MQGEGAAAAHGVACREGRNTMAHNSGRYMELAARRTELDAHILLGSLENK